MPESDAVVDLEVLKRYVGDDAATIADFLSQFRNSVQGHAAALAPAVAAREVGRIAFAAHALKSTARAGGASSFGNVLADLEVAADRHDFEAVDRYYLEFQRMLPLVLARLDVLAPPT